MPRTENTGMDGGPCGKGAVLLRLLGRKSLASSTLAPSASRSAVIGHGIGPGIQSAKKRVGSAWRNAVGHTCPMRSRTFLLGVTAAHGSLEPIVLVRNQEEEHNRRLRQPAVGNGLQNRERWVRPPTTASQRQHSSFRFLPLHSNDVLYRTYRVSASPQAAKTMPSPL